MPTTTTKTYRKVGRTLYWDMDRDAHKRFPFNWAAWLAAEGSTVTIASVAWVLGANVTNLQSGNDTTSASILVKLTDASLPDPQIVTCRITTNETPPQVQDFSIWINPTDE